MRIDVIDTRAAFDELRTGWNALLAEDAATPLGMDGTATFEWAGALLDAFLEEGQWLVVVASDSRGIAGVLPVYWTRFDRPDMDPTTLAVLTELCGGRNGFLVRDGSADILRAMMRHLQEHVRGWRKLIARVVVDGRSHAMLGVLYPGYKGRLTFEREEVSPYLVLPDDLDAYLRTLSPNFRKEVQRRERRLHDLGDVRLRICDAPADAADLWQAILDVEKSSWKEDAGSSITAKQKQEAFYRTLIPRVADRGQLLSAILALDGAPVAYSLAVRFADTVIGLKASYSAIHGNVSPATTLRKLQLAELQRRGVKVFDFMGACEPHKMRWTQSTYAVHTYCLFNEGFAAAAAHASRVLKTFLMPKLKTG